MLKTIWDGLERKKERDKWKKREKNGYFTDSDEQIKLEPEDRDSGELRWILYIDGIGLDREREGKGRIPAGISIW